jgi:hypothetical protein
VLCCRVTAGEVNQGITMRSVKLEAADEDTVHAGTPMTTKGKTTAKVCQPSAHRSQELLLQQVIWMLSQLCALWHCIPEWQGVQGSQSN